MHSESRVRWIVIGLALLHGALAIWFASVTPYRSSGILRFQNGTPVPDVGAPDERQHANYVQHLLDGKGLPVLVWEIPDPANPGQTRRNPDLGESYQAHQPPLFYILEAAWAKVADVSNVGDASGIRLRWLNALIGAVGVLGVYWLAFWGRRNQAVAVGAAAFAALLPMNLALSGAISNDPLLFALCTWTLALTVRSLREGWSLPRSVLIGVLAGLAILTKTTAVALLPILLLALWLGKREGKGAGIKQVAAATLAIALFALPWWLRNHSLYGDPLALKAFSEAFVGSPSPGSLSTLFDALGPEGLPGWIKYWTGYNDIGLGVGWWTLRSFFGVFGYMDIFLHSRLYLALSLMLGALLIAAWLPDRSEEARDARAPRLVGIGFFVLVLLFFLRFNTQYFQAQARYLLPAIGPISVAVGIGAVRLGKAKPWIAVGLIVGILFALDVGILSWLPGEFERRLATPR